MVNFPAYYVLLPALAAPLALRTEQFDVHDIEGTTFAMLTELCMTYPHVIAHRFLPIELPFRLSLRVVVSQIILLLLAPALPPDYAASNGYNQCCEASKCNIHPNICCEYGEDVAVAGCYSKIG